MKIIASDFDGTLLIRNKLREGDLRSIKSFQDRGNLFGIVTGRSFHSLNKLIEGKLSPDFVIANNGSHILIRNEKAMTELVKFTLDKTKVARLINFYKPYFPVKIFTDKARSLDRLDEIMDREEILALAIYSDKNLDNPFDEDFSFHKSIGVIDVINKQVSKKTGIEFIKDFYGYDKEIYSIGDDLNDISFLEASRLSFTLNSVSEEEVLKVSNYKVENIEELIENIEKWT